MEIIYRSRTDHKRQAGGEPEPVLQLSWNNWDDYGHKTSLVAHLHLAEGERQLDPIRILVAGESFTANYLEKLIESGWDGIFPPPDTRYISNPSGISFYEELIAIVGQDAALSAAETLRDASLLGV